jgi:signal transduction histidine kinase/FixJ family two-component response regulator/HPt (histidine-containing phosphotransfer) domain-containing protein
MKTNARWNDVIKKNYHQVLFVLAAFLIMALAGYFFVSGILRDRLLANADDNLFSAEANIRAALAESEITLNTSFHIILSMIEKNASQGEILEYLKSTTAWMRKNQRGLMEFYGIYGYIRGEYLSGMEFTPGEDYLPQTRPWYQTAIRSGNVPVAYTPPYVDIRTGEVIVSAVKNILDEEGNLYGILAIDINMEWINGYIKTLHLGSGGYGMVVSQNMVIMVHPDQSALGKQLQELGGAFGDISRRLRIGEELSALRHKNAGGGRVITFFRRMFNGWYVGLITPTRAYYRDIHYAALILSAVGFLMTCALSYLLLRISAAKMKADEDRLSKSTFLAKMSHEIRTPMNAIIGMSELVLREELNSNVRNYTENIRQAGNNLLSIINDILDFSKIESGKMDIVNVKYQFASIINDVIAIVRMRLNEKPVSFITKIEGSLPAVLVGDEVRVRQILLNLLTNAVKYTREGSITLSIRRKDPSGDQENTETGGKKPRILLAFEVADTGIGIKKEDMEKLFGNFTQFDKNQNRNIEGTGLGLAISRNLCLLMDGDIAVNSAYGQGSVFTAFIPQLVEDDTPFALVEHPETKTALVYENRPLYAESIVYTIDNLGVGCAAARTRDDFVEQLAGGAWQFIFTSPALFDEVREILQNRTPAPGAEAGGAGESSPSTEPMLILLSEYGQAPRPDIHTVFMPLQPVAVANILNGQRSDTGYHGIETPGVRFIAPEARILIVDDIETNLNVAEGLLAPYKMRIDRASGGLEAVHLARENRYDLILMDHMMPGMDGIEAAETIRDWERDCQKSRDPAPGDPGEKSAAEVPREIPIVALTANAVSGMREMFLEKGFNDYISKPIEIAKLDDMMTRWIPPEKRVKAGAGIKRETFSGAAGIVIPGVDVKRGINMTGGTEAGYRKVLAQFCGDAAERLDWFRNFPPEGGGEDGLAVFTAHAHALKSAAGTIGAAEVSEAAAALETAGKAGDRTAIGEGLPRFCERLAGLVEGAGKALKTGTRQKREGKGEKERKGQTASFFSSRLPPLRAALDAKNMREIDKLLGEIEKLPLDEKDMDSINAVSDKVLMGEYQGAIETINILLAAKGD